MLKVHMKFCFTENGAAYSLRALKRMGALVRGDVYVEKSVKVWRGAKLCGPCVVTGESVLCEGCAVLPFSHISDSFIGRNAVIRASTLEDARVGENSTVGPYAYLRCGAKVGGGCRVGDFVEVKNAVLGDGTKAAHLSYIGDAVLGKKVNVGCGVVFANYDGQKKQQSQIGDGAFIGCNCNIVAPVCLADGVYVAAGTTVTRDLQQGDFCIGRCREKVKPHAAEGRYKDGQILRD